MKNYFYVFLLILFYSNILGQEKEISRFSTDIKMVLYSGLGNKYFKNSFASSPGVDLKFQFKINQKIGMFLDIRNVFIKIKNPEIFGEFTNINMMNYNFGGSYTHRFNKKLDAEASLFLGDFGYKGTTTSNDSQYSQSGFTYGVGANAIYHLDKKGTVDLVGGLDYQNLKSKLKISNPYYQDYYNHSDVLIPNLGIRFNF